MINKRVGCVWKKIKILYFSYFARLFSHEFVGYCWRRCLGAKISRWVHGNIRWFVSLCTIFLAACATNSPTPTGAVSDPLTLFEQRVQIVSQAVNRKPSKPPKYGSRKGAALKGLFDTSELLVVYQYVLQDVPHSEQRLTRYENALKLLEPIAKLYSQAFNNYPGEYDREFIDVSEFNFYLIYVSQAALKNLDLSDPTIAENELAEAVKDFMEPTKKLLELMPPMFISGFDSLLSSGKIRPNYRLEAERRLYRMLSTHKKYLATDEVELPQKCDYALTDSDKHFLESVYKDLYFSRKACFFESPLTEKGKKIVDGQLRVLRAGLSSYFADIYVLGIENTVMQQIANRSSKVCDSGFSDYVERTAGHANRIKGRLLCGD